MWVKEETSTYIIWTYKTAIIKHLVASSFGHDNYYDMYVEDVYIGSYITLEQAQVYLENLVRD